MKIFDLEWRIAAQLIPVLVAADETHLLDGVSGGEHAADAS